VVWTSDQTAALIGQQQQMAMQGQQMAQSIGAGLHMPMPRHPAAGHGIHSYGRGAAGTALSTMASPVNLANKVTGFAGMGLMGAGLTGWAGGKLGLGVTGRGLMASMGGLGGGAVGALGSLPAFAAVGAAAYGANQMVAGYRETAQVGSLMAQNYSFSNPNAFSGQGFNPKDVSQIAKTMRSVATSSQTGMDDIMQTFQSMSDMGMMQTVRSAQDFEKKFKGMIDSVKKISHTFSTSMTEAAELLGSMRSSGLYTAQDVLGGTLQRQVLGAHGLSAQQVTGLQRSGAATAAQIGARRGTGARLNTGLAAAVGTAARMGVISSEDLIEATGMEGADAYAAMGQRLGEASMQFTQGQAGRAAMIYAGEMKDGRFTGRMNAGAMDDILSGRVGIDKMLSVAGERTQDARGKASFAAKSHEMSGNFAQGGGNEAMMAIVRSIVDKLEPGADKNDMITLVMDKIAGVDRQTAALLVKMSGEYDDIRREQGQEAQQLIQSRAREYEREYYRSWGGVKRRIKQGWKESVSDPIKGVGGDIGTDIEMGVESIANMVYGRYRSESISGEEMKRVRLMSYDDRQAQLRQALQGERIHILDGFTGGTRGRLSKFTGPGGYITFDEDNTDELMSVLSGEGAMGAGFGTLEGVSQDAVDNAAIGLGFLAGDMDLQGKEAASHLLTRLRASKTRTARQEQALQIIQDKSGAANIGSSRSVMTPEQRGVALETVTSLMRAGGVESFGADGTFNATAVDQLLSGKAAAAKHDLFGGGGLLKGGARLAGGAIGGAVGGVIVGAPTGGLGAALGAGMGAGVGASIATGMFMGSAADKTGSLREVLSGPELRGVERLLEDTDTRAATLRILKGDITDVVSKDGQLLTKGSLEGLGAYASGVDNEELRRQFGTIGEAGSSGAKSLYAAASAMAEMTESEASAVRGALTRFGGTVGTSAIARLSAAEATVGSELLSNIKQVPGSIRGAVEAYAKQVASQKRGDLEPIVAALDALDAVDARDALRILGNVPGGASLKAQLEARLALAGMDASTSAADISEALTSAGVADAEELGSALAGRSDLIEQAVFYAGSQDTSVIAQAGGTRARSTHVETALVTKMEGLIGGMDTLITSQTLAIESMDKVVEGHDKKLIELEKHP